MPLELLTAPETLNGESGTNRAPAFITQQISAKNDLEAVQSWLSEFDESPHKKIRLQLGGKHTFMVEHVELGGFATLSLKLMKLY